MSEGQDYFLYILWCDRTVEYTGIAIDPAARLAQHQQGHPHGAKFTRRFKQLEIVYQVKAGNRSTAQSLEIKLKKLNTDKKNNIIKSQYTLAQLIELLT